MKGSFRKRGCRCKGKKCTCGAKWSFRIDVGINPKTGRRKQIERGGFKTKAEAVAAAVKLYAEIMDGTYVEESDITFEEFAKEWLSEYKTTVKTSTVRVRKHEIARLMDYF